MKCVLSTILLESLTSSYSYIYIRLGQRYYNKFPEQGTVRNFDIQEVTKGDNPPPLLESLVGRKRRIPLGKIRGWIQYPRALEGLVGRLDNHRSTVQRQPMKR